MSTTINGFSSLYYLIPRNVAGVIALITVFALTAYQLYSPARVKSSVSL